MNKNLCGLRSCTNIPGIEFRHTGFCGIHQAHAAIVGGNSQEQMSKELTGLTRKFDVAAFKAEIETEILETVDRYKESVELDGTEEAVAVSDLSEIVDEMLEYYVEIESKASDLIVSSWGGNGTEESNSAAAVARDMLWSAARIYQDELLFELLDDNVESVFDRYLESYEGESAPFRNADSITEGVMRVYENHGSAVADYAFPDSETEDLRRLAANQYLSNMIGLSAQTYLRNLPSN